MIAGRRTETPVSRAGTRAGRPFHAVRSADHPWAMIALLAFALGAAFGAALALNLARASRRSDDELIERFQQEMRALEGERKHLGGQLSQQLTALNDQTRSLSEALRRPGVRGRWGELTLRNVVEAAEMSEHCDFSSQEHLADRDGAIRPDMVVRLPGRGRLAVDAKVPLDSYLDALEVDDSETRQRLLATHAGSVRQKVKQLADKGYARRVGRSPELVVMFVASEAAFSAAALADPKLLEDAARQRVVIATPATMVALLQAVGLAWREARLSERAERVRELAVELCRRIASFADHLSNSGNGIERAARAHNEAVGSFDGRILPTARRMAELGVADGATIETPARVETQVRPSANGNGSQAELGALN
jgi:DNA recombination protein RmuC